MNGWWKQKRKQPDESAEVEDRELKAQVERRLKALEAAVRLIELRREKRWKPN